MRPKERSERRFRLRRVLMGKDTTRMIPPAVADGYDRHCRHARRPLLHTQWQRFRLRFANVTEFFNKLLGRLSAGRRHGWRPISRQQLVQAALWYVGMDPDSLHHIFDAKMGERHDPVVTDAVNPDDAVLRIYSVGHVPKPVLVFAGSVATRPMVKTASSICDKNASSEPGTKHFILAVTKLGRDAKIEGSKLPILGGDDGAQVN